MTLGLLPTRSPESLHELERRPTSSLSEASLFRGYSRPDPELELRDCRCGGQVEADPRAPEAGVKAHAKSGRHEAWAIEQGLRDG